METTSSEPINVFPLEKFIQQVKAADASNRKEVRIDINQAKLMAFTIALVMTRINGDLEKLVMNKSSKSDETVIVTVDPGSNW